MPRLRRYLPPLLILLPVIFICGKLLLTPVNVDGNNDDVESTYGQGWPWEFHNYKEAKPGWHVVHDITPWPMFSWWLLLADLAVLSGIIILCARLLVWRGRTGRGHWQFSLGGLLVVTAISAVAMGWWVRELAQWKHEEHHREIWTSDEIKLPTNNFAPQWAKRLLPERALTIFERADCLAFLNPSSTQTIENALPRLLDLPHVSRIFIVSNPLERPVRITNPDILRNIERITYLCADDETMKALGNAPQLRALTIYGRVTERGFEDIAQCQSLQELTLQDIELTEPGAQQLLRMPNLSYLQFKHSAKLSAETVLRLQQQIAEVDVLHSFP